LRGGLGEAKPNAAIPRQEDGKEYSILLFTGGALRGDCFAFGSQ